MQTTFVLRSEVNTSEFYQSMTRQMQAVTTPDINAAMHFPDVDTANLNRDSISEQTGHNFSVEEVNA